MASNPFTIAQESARDSLLSGCRQTVAHAATPADTGAYRREAPCSSVTVLMLLRSLE